MVGSGVSDWTAELSLGSYLLSKMARCKSIHLRMEMLSQSPVPRAWVNPVL